MTANGNISPSAICPVTCSICTVSIASTVVLRCSYLSACVAGVVWCVVAYILVFNSVA